MVSTVMALLAERRLGDSAGGTLPFADIKDFIKVKGTLQYGDVVNMLCQNSKFLTSKGDANSCQAAKVAGREEDWALVDPKNPHKYGAAVTSGAPVSTPTLP